MHNKRSVINTAALAAVTLIFPSAARAIQYRLVDLTPPGALHSTLYGVNAGDYVNSKSAIHAARWTGGPSDYVDLNPGSSFRSQAFGSDGVQQVGYAWDAQSVSHAALWSGSADSYIDLSGGAESVAYDVWGNSQVGMTGADDLAVIIGSDCTIESAVAAKRKHPLRGSCTSGNRRLQ